MLVNTNYKVSWLNNTLLSAYTVVRAKFLEYLSVHIALVMSGLNEAELILNNSWTLNNVLRLLPNNSKKKTLSGVSKNLVYPAKKPQKYMFAVHFWYKRINFN